MWAIPNFLNDGYGFAQPVRRGGGHVSTGGVEVGAQISRMQHHFYLWLTMGHLKFLIHFLVLSEVEKRKDFSAAVRAPMSSIY